MFQDLFTIRLWEYDYIRPDKVNSNSSDISNGLENVFVYMAIFTESTL